MSGLGKRFVDAGYREVKPLIEVDGKPMLSHVISLFPGIPYKDIHLIVRQEHELKARLETMFEGIQIHEIAGHSLGPVYAVSQIFPEISGNTYEEIIVSYCDYGTVWDFTAFLKEMREANADGGIAAYRGFHPHMLGTDNYAFLRLDTDGNVAEVREKEPFTENRMSEFASNGTYYFRTIATMIQYFQKALADTEGTYKKNGEYYVSLIYNAMANDGLCIKPFEIQKMLQWGTPRDLQEYCDWSTHFCRRAKIPTSCAKLILPLAGKGSRFQMKGYTTPKPLIDINGEPMIVRAVQSIPTCQKNIFICLEEHLRNYPLQKTLLGAFSEEKTTVVSIPETTEGQACTCAIGLENAGVLPEDPILISACDNGVDFDPEAYMALENDPSVDVIVWSFTNNPTSKRFPHMYAWMDVDHSGTVKQVSVKKYLEGAEHCIIGTMFFRKAGIFQEGFRAIQEANIRTNGEFYVDDMLNVLIQKGYTVKVFPVDAYICWGTPTDYEIYQYWYEHFSKVWGKPRIM